MSAREEPRWALGAAWAALVEGALASTGGEEAVLEALAMASTLELLPSLVEAASPSARRRLVARGAALVLSSSRESDGSDEAVARSRALTLARDGLRALRAAIAREGATASPRRRGAGPKEASRTLADAPGGAGPEEPPAAAATVSAAMLRRLLDGNLDGFAAAELARVVSRSPATRVELGVLFEHGRVAPRTVRASPAASPRLRLVADDAPALRDPAEGRPLGTGRSGAVELESIRFPDGIVAIYAAPPRRIAVPVLPAGVKVVRTAVGYIELDVKKTRAKEVDVAVGSHRVPLAIR